MNKFYKKIIVGMTILSITIQPVFAESMDGLKEKPNINEPGLEKPSNNEQAPLNTPSNVTFAGMTNISENVAESNKSYHSITSYKNSILVSNGISTLTNPTITKSGDATGDMADFYGTNAAVLVHNGATLNINGGTVTTDGAHANAVFAYNKGIINIEKTNINTTNNNSGGIMVTGGGILTAKDLNVKTTSSSSAAIRSDRGGGKITVEGGTYETNGVGSPAIYSTANITVNNTNLLSTASEGVVVEGNNSVTLNSTKLTDTNTTLNGNSETYKNIFIYQSMSGDAKQGEGSFTAKDSEIITNKGDTIFVTNTSANIVLENNSIINNDGDFLRVQSGKWGRSGYNGGIVTLKMNNQKVGGNIIIDSLSELDLSLNNNSLYSGAINSINEAKNINVTLSSDSIINLTGDTYINSLTNENSDNTNIYLNGYKLYVNGNSIDANNSTYDKELPTTNNKTQAVKEDSNNLLFVIIVSTLILVISLLIFVFIRLKNKNNKKEVI